MPPTTEPSYPRTLEEVLAALAHKTKQPSVEYDLADSARAALTANRHALDALVAALLERESLEGHEVVEIVEGAVK